MIETLLQKIGQGILAIGFALSSLFGFHQVPQQNVGATVPVVVAVFQTSLQASITSSATSMTLVSGTDKAGNSLSGYICFNIDEGTSIEEFVCGTTSGTAVTSMIRGIDPVDGDTEVTALKKAHRRGASVKITNYPSLGIISRIINGTETIPNAIKYATGVAPSTADDLADKGYVDGVAIAGGADASTTVKGISKLSVAPVSATNPIAVGDNDTRIPTQDENNALVGNNTDVAVGTGNKFVTQTGLQHNAEKYAADAGSNDTYVITLSPAPTSYTAGMIIHFKANTVNTGAATLNVNGLGAKTIVKNVNTTLSDGDIAAGMLSTVIYDGTNLVLQSTPASLTSTDVQTFTTDGTWTKPNGAKSVLVQAWGAGGGGGGGASGSGGGGGGGGSYFEWTFNATDLSGTEAIVVGEGVAATQGENSTFGSTKLVAYGGGAGISQASGGGGGGGGGISSIGSNGSSSTGGAGGGVSGGAGGSGAVGGVSLLGGGGGGAAANTGFAGGLSAQGGGGGGGGSTNVGDPSPGAAGGSSFYGGGGGGSGGGASSGGSGGTSVKGGGGGAGALATGNGTAGSIPAGGGGGGAGVASTGGAGARGQIVVTTFF